MDLMVLDKLHYIFTVDDQVDTLPMTTYVSNPSTDVSNIFSLIGAQKGKSRELFPNNFLYY